MTKNNSKPPEYSTLYRAVVYRDWETAKNLLTTHPNSLQLTEYSSSRRGETALHNACWWGGPVHIIKLFHQVNPSLLMQLDNQLRSPLRYACGYASKEVVEFLIDATPMAARLLDSDGLLPLHIAIKNRRSPSIIQKLVEAYPEAINQYTHCLRSLSHDEDDDEIDRKTPLQLLCMKWNDDLSANINHLEYLAKGMDCDGLSTLKGSLYSFLKTLFQTVQANIDDTNSDHLQHSFQFPLHQTIELDNEILPPIFKEFIIIILCEQDASLKDSRGNLPLHLAAAQTGEESNLIPLLLDRYPEASAISNEEGRLPLSLAIESGKSWDKGGIRRLVKEAPQVLCIRDVKTHLYPFMLAAASADASADNTSIYDENESVDVTYELLRFFPELIQRCIPFCES